jgi:hypothetical protein
LGYQTVSSRVSLSLLQWDAIFHFSVRPLSLILGDNSEGQVETLLFALAAMCATGSSLRALFN